MTLPPLPEPAVPDTFGYAEIWTPDTGDLFQKQQLIAYGEACRADELLERK